VIEKNGGAESLVIASRSSQDWALGHKKLFQARPGEVFNFSGRVKIAAALESRPRNDTNKIVGALSVALYDADMQVKEWNFAMETVAGADNWRKVDRTFTVPVGVKYLRFRLSGWGVGKAWFEGISFKKLRDKSIEGTGVGDKIKSINGT
jgi:hypothetical protein